MTTDLILGTAGHIDHGKTSLIAALSGTDTDRLPEEKRRGITIELGFAELLLGDYRLGIVDVPGHERFVRNMLAGATGMDLAMLVVAADDGVKQQTREHLDILRLLHLEYGVIALTKCDLVEPDWLALVEEEIRELLAGTFLEEAPIIRTSAPKGAGLEELRQALSEAAARAAAGQRMRMIDAPFRMAIDRAFAMPGHGTVVTGSVASGRVSVGDSLVVEPGGIEVRVRSLQNHDRPVETLHRGQRAAINLAGIHHGQIERGQDLAARGHLQPTRLLTAEISLLKTAPRPLKSRTRVRLHLGTNELLASVVLLGADALEPGETALAQLFLNQPAVAVWNQPLVLRSESPVVTIGGGRVLHPSPEKLRRPDSQTLQLLHQLGADDELARAGAALYFAGLGRFDPRELARTVGTDRPEELAASLLEKGDLVEIAASPTRTVRLHRLRLAELGGRIEAALGHLHDENPLRRFFSRTQLASQFRYLSEPALLDAALTLLNRSGRIQLDPRGISLAGRGPKLSANEQKLFEWLLDRYRQAGLQPPTVKQTVQEAPVRADSVAQLLSLAAAEGELVEVSSEYYLHAEAERSLRQQVAEALAGGQGLTMSQIRDLLGTSRKYAVPFGEYLDRSGLTRREGDLRFLAASSTPDPSPATSPEGS